MAPTRGRARHSIQNIASALLNNTCKPANWHKAHTSEPCVTNRRWHLPLLAFLSAAHSAVIRHFAGERERERAKGRICYWRVNLTLATHDIAMDYKMDACENCLKVPLLRHQEVSIASTKRLLFSPGDWGNICTGECLPTPKQHVEGAQRLSNDETLGPMAPKEDSKGQRENEQTIHGQYTRLMGAYGASLSLPCVQ